MLKIGTWLMLLWIILLKVNEIWSYDYCKLEEKYCDKAKHILCHPEQMKAKAGRQEYNSKYNVLPMTSKVRKAIVDEHNKLRNNLACGEVPDKEGNKYPPAGHMRELIWDIELEYTALAHAKLCIFAHDECRATSKYENAGQNLAVRYTSTSENMMEYVRYFVNAWYDEYKLATVADIMNIKGTPGIGHFTQLSNDRVHRVGCAVTRCDQKELENGQKITKYLYTCNYSFSNMFGFPTYTNSSKPANNCGFVKSAKSAKYKCLCANTNHDWPLK